VRSLLNLFIRRGEPGGGQHNTTYWAFPADWNNTVATHTGFEHKEPKSLLSQFNFQFCSDIRRPVFCPTPSNIGTTLSPYNSAGPLDTPHNGLQYLKLRPFATR
jgi:hypothetical protein